MTRYMVRGIRAASRRRGQGPGAIRRFVSWGAALLAPGARRPGPTPTGGSNGFRRETLEGIGLDEVTKKRQLLPIELEYRALKRGSFRVVERDDFPDRVLGKSKMSKQDLP